MLDRASKSKDFYAGTLFTLIGLSSAYKATDYAIGSATSMGPGFFPELLGIVLTILGISMLVSSLLVPLKEQVEIEEKRSLVPLALITIGVFGFVLSIDRVGLVAAIAILLSFACLKHLIERPIEVVLTIFFLIVFAVGVFIYGFTMPFRAF